MTTLTAQEVREAFEIIRQLVPPFAVDLVDVLERRLILDESWLAMQDRYQLHRDTSGDDRKDLEAVERMLMAALARIQDATDKRNKTGIWA